MDDDYKVLGLMPGADKQEIKRSYFKLVRQYSPEKEPERFQEIREAYERLSRKNQEKKGLDLEIPDEPLAKQMLQQMDNQMRNEDYEDAADTAEEALKYFGDCEGFLYYAAEAQLITGHSGKAVRYYEKLLKMYPDKNIYKEKLAGAYFERGYGVKAYQMFERAYQDGSRDMEFLFLFSMCCKERNRQDRGMEILWNIVKEREGIDRNLVTEYLEAYMGLFALDVMSEERQLAAIAEHLKNYLHEAGRLMKKHEEDLLSIAFFVSASVSGKTHCPEVDDLLDEIKRYVSLKEYKEEWEEMDRLLLENRLEGDSRLGEEISCWYYAYLLAPEMYDYEIIKYTQLEAKLLLMERWPELKSQTDIVKAEYPILYEKMREFVELLESGADISYQKEKYLKEYDRLDRNISGGRYYELYPQNRITAEDKLQWNSWDEGTFVRTEKKVGRNDPCPCGSGKKYKNCCGRQ